MPVRIKVGRSDKIPSSCRKWADGLGTKKRSAVMPAEEVNINLASLLINKENVWMTIAIQVGNCSCCPLRARRRQSTEMPQSCISRATVRENCQRASRIIGIDKTFVAVVPELPHAHQ